jgi:2-C-methyl-D-erythritol 4-phosphate cytidylyltransferase
MMFNRQQVGAVIVGAGRGERMGGVDKMFMLLADSPVLSRTVSIFEASSLVDRLVLVLNTDNIERGKRLIVEEGWSKIIDIVAGGARRQDSVMAGLALLQGCRWVVIHDGARPLVTAALIENGLLAAQETGASVCAIPVSDTIKHADDNGFVIDTPDRKGLWSVQTPQIFSFDIITQAYRVCDDDVTDDASLVEKAGFRIRLFMGTYDNIKLTTPIDLDLAGALLRRRGS